MTKEIVIRLRDDFDHDVADDVQTRFFTWEGVEYELELSDANYAHWRNQMQPYLSVARPVKRARKKSTPAKKAAKTAAASDRGVIRAWAKKRGYPVKDRGEISREVRDAYYKAHRRGKKHTNV